MSPDGDGPQGITCGRVEGPADRGGDPGPSRGRESCGPRSAVRLDEIHFVRPASLEGPEAPPADACVPILLSRDGVEPLPGPDWIPSRTLPEGSPLCLARGRGGLRIWARIGIVPESVDLPRKGRIHLRAEEAGFQLVAPPPEGPGDGWGPPDPGASGGRLVGDAEAGPIDVEGLGTTCLAEMVVHDVDLGARPAGIYHFRWTWWLRCSEAGGGPAEWLHFATTSHRLYLLHDRPGEPWFCPGRPGEAPLSPFSIRPWIRALDLALGWGGGTVDRLEGAGRIACAFHHFGSSRPGFPGLTYSAASATFATITPERSLLHLGDLLDALEGHTSRGQDVNCDDCALAVCVLANLTGCRLRRLRIADVGPKEQPRRRAIYCNPVLGMGWPQHMPVTRSGTFAYHAVAWEPCREEPGANPLVLDAALRLAARTDATPMIPQPPLQLYAPERLEDYLRALAVGPAAIEDWPIQAVWPGDDGEPLGSEPGWPMLTADAEGALGVARSRRLSGTEDLAALLGGGLPAGLLPGLPAGWKPWSHFVVPSAGPGVGVSEVVLHREPPPQEGEPGRPEAIPWWRPEDRVCRIAAFRRAPGSEVAAPDRIPLVEAVLGRYQAEAPGPLSLGPPRFLGSPSGAHLVVDEGERVWELSRDVAGPARRRDR